MAATGLFVQYNLDTETIGGGWKLYHYAPGTTTLKNLYSDRDMQNTVAQPLVADANGVVSFYADGLYDLHVYTSADVLKYTWEDVYFAEIQSLGVEGATLVSAGTLILGATAEIYNHVSGTATISALSGTQPLIILTFDAAATLTHGASFVLRNSVTRQMRVDETVMFVNDGGGVWREVSAVLRLANAQWLTSRNAAGNAEIDVVRVNSSNRIELGAAVSGGIVLNDGLLDLSGTSAGQVKFPTAVNLSADAHTLDDYEEGTWTPSLGGDTTYFTQAGYYKKEGNEVTVVCNLSVNVLGTGSVNTISGLPFTNINIVGGTGAVEFFSAVVNTTSMVAIVQASATTIRIKSSPSAAASIGTSNVFGNNASVNFSLSYFTEE